MVRLNDLIESYPNRAVVGDPRCAVNDITDDSRRVKHGACYIERHTHAEDAPRYIDDALDRGALAVISDRPPPPQWAGLKDPLAAWIRLPQVDQETCGHIAERFFGHPSAKLNVVGITGTNGKTTTAFLLQHLLNTAGTKCGLIGSIYNDTGDERLESSLTTPGAVEFTRLLARMADAGCHAASVEVSSHALAQGRTDAITFAGAVFTNLTGDHLDYHDSYDAYASAKARLFSRLKYGTPAVINAADEYARWMVSRSMAKVRWSLVEGGGRAKTPHVDYRGTVQSIDAAGSNIRTWGPFGMIQLRLPLVGRFNVSNALQAAAIAHELGAPHDAIEQALLTAPPVPGRVEPVRAQEPTNQPAVVVDYAHTHDALENVLTALRPLTPGRLTVVFGCGGDRDREKRPKMARVATRLADRVVITSDNPRTEDPNAIIEDALRGARDRQNVIVEPDRAKAIDTAIAGESPNDTILIAGKGHERYQIVGKNKIPFDDRDAALASLKARLVTG